MYQISLITQAKQTQNIYIYLSSFLQMAIVPQCHLNKIFHPSTTFTMITNEENIFSPPYYTLSKTSTYKLVIYYRIKSTKHPIYQSQNERCLTKVYIKLVNMVPLVAQVCNCLLIDPYKKNKSEKWIVHSFSL